MIDLAAAARFELAERHRLYPGHVTAGNIDADWAERDTGVWHCIATMLAEGRREPALLWDEFTLTWQDVRRSLDQAVDARAAACAKRPGDPARIARHHAVHAIASRLTPVADRFIAFNEARRTRATQPDLLAA